MTEDRLSSSAILQIHKGKEINVGTAQRKAPRSLLINDNFVIKRKTLLSACSRIHNQNNVLFAPSLLKIRARPGEGTTPYNGLYGEAPPERGTFLISRFRYIKGRDFTSRGI